MHIFQYGSNVDESRLNAPDRLDGNAARVGLAQTIDCFELDFTHYSKTNKCAAADLIGGGGRRIWGIVYKIPTDWVIPKPNSRQHTTLDEIEGPNYQRVEIVTSRADGGPLTDRVETYVVRKKKFGIKTNLHYVRHIILGLKLAGAPDDYIGYVRQRAVLNNPSLAGHLP